VITRERPTAVPTPQPVVRRGRLLSPAWPIYAIFLGFPIWWSLGMSAFIWPILAIPMLVYLMKRGRIVIPRHFGIWLLFVLWVLASALELNRGTAILTFFYRFSLYLSATVIFLFVLNTSKELPSRTVACLLAGFFCMVVVFGFLALALPGMNFSSPVEGLLLHFHLDRILANPFLFQLVHPRLAQVQGFLGHSSPRPTAPFLYSNNWGATFALLVPFVFAAMAIARSRFWKNVLVIVLLASIVPLVVSVNRGAWISLAGALLYLLLRFWTRRNVRAVTMAIGVFVTALLVILASPLRTVITERLAHPHSDQGRSLLYQQAADRIVQSPWLGFGGPLPPPPGRILPDIGTQGQFWIVLISNGIPAEALFLAWFLFALWKSRGGGSKVRFWASVTLFMFLIQVWVYEFLPVELHLLMIAAALAWRERLIPPEPAPVAATPEGTSLPAGAAPRHRRSAAATAAWR
jgi:polysaccharide biosynthesis protein PslJ